MTSVNLFDACSDAFFKKCEKLEKDISTAKTSEKQTPLLPILQQLKETACVLEKERSTIHDMNHHLTVLEEKASETPGIPQEIEQKIEELKEDWQKLVLLDVLKQGEDAELDADRLHALGQIIAKMDPESRSHLLLQCASNENFALRQLAFDCLKYGCSNLDITDDQGRSALYHACLQREYALWEALLKAGAKVDQKDKSGVSLLEYLFYHEASSKMTEALMMHQPPDLNKPLGKMPLWLAFFENELVGRQADWAMEFFLKHIQEIHSLDARNKEGRTALEIADRKGDVTMYVQLILHGSQVSKDSKTLQKACQEMLMRDLQGPQDLLFFQKLKEQDALPKELLGGRDPEIAYTRAIHGSLAQLGVPHETMNLIDHYAELVKQFQNTSTLSTQVKLAEQLKDVIEKMQVAGFSDIAKFQDFYEALTSETWKLQKEALQHLEDFEINPDSSWSFLKEKWTVLGEREVGIDDLLQLCVDQKKQDLIPTMVLTWIGTRTKLEVIDKPVFNFLLDKTHFPQAGKPFSGGKAYHNAAHLYNVLNSMQTSSEQNILELQPIIDQLADQLLPALPNFIKWSSAVNPQEVAFAISHIEEGKPVLIPVEMKGHAMCILIDDRIHFFNTGFGLPNNQPELPGTNRFQTFLTIENVPIQHLEDPKIWQAFFEICQDEKLPAEERVNQIYDFYRNNLGQGLPPTPPSKDQEDYEQIQMSGTCSAQNLMACLRHMIMEIYSGTKTEKLAAYKMIKSQVLDHLAGGKVSEVDQKIKEAAEKKIEKHVAAMYLSLVASDESECQKNLETLLATLSQLGEKEFVEGMQQAKPQNLFDRYHMLRLCSQRIAHHWLENPQTVNLGNMPDDLKLATSIFESRRLTETQIEKDFQIIYNRQDYKRLGADLASLLTKTSFQQIAFRWILEKQCPETLDLSKPKDRARIDYLLSGMQSNRGKPFQQMLIERFEKAGRKEMAEYVREYAAQPTTAKGEPQFH